MRFALLGNHHDGVDLASAILCSSNHSLIACSGLGEPPSGWEAVKRFSDVEEILADPAVEALIVAGNASVRPEQLRRALQSERHVLCVHPADGKPDIAHEAALIRQDTGYQLMPILPEGLHPAFEQLAGLVASGESSPLGAFRLVTWERTGPNEILDNTAEGLSPSVPGWDVLRRLGGEVIEVSSFAEAEEMRPGQPLVIAGRFLRGGMFQVTYLPNRPSAHWHLTVIGTKGQAVLTFPIGWDGPAILEWHEQDQRQMRYFERWDPWPEVLRQFEMTINRQSPRLIWQDAVRGLELDDAARRGVEKRRGQVLEYQEVNEEVGFKGTMTLVGCSIVWVVLLLLIASRWVPWLGWVILPVLVVFVGLQLLRYIIPPTK